MSRRRILTGTIGADALRATQPSEIRGLGGNDTITGSAGSDVIFFKSSAGLDRVSAGAGNDLIVAGVESYTVIDGGTGTDTLRLTGHWWDYLTNPLVRVLKPGKVENQAWITGTSIERLEYQIEHGPLLDMADSPNRARPDSIRVTGTQIGRVEVLANDRAPDLIVEAELVETDSPLQAQLRFLRDPTLPGGQRAWVLIDGGSGRPLKPGERETVTLKVKTTDVDGDVAITPLTVTRVGAAQTSTRFTGTLMGVLEETAARLFNPNASVSGEFSVTKASDPFRQIGVKMPAAADLQGEFGRFTVNPRGGWSYRADEAELDGLGSKGAIETLTLESRDGRVERTVTVILQGENDLLTGEFERSGAAEVDQTLSVNSGSLADAEGLGAIRWQWLRNDAPILGATGNRYVVRPGDVGAEISVRARYVDRQGGAESASVSFGEVADSSILVTTLQDVVSAGDGVVSLREALAQAAADPGADVIRFQPGLSGVIHLQSSGLTLDAGNYVTILGERRITLDGNYDGDNDIATFSHTDLPGVEDRSILTIDDKAGATLDGLGFTGGRAELGGAIHAFLVQETVEIRNSWFHGNTAFRQGGAIFGNPFDWPYDREGTVVTDSVFFDNHSGEDGGAVHGAVISGSSFYNNSAGRDGGAVNFADISTSSFTGNSAASGGAVASVSVYQSSFVGNTATVEGNDGDRVVTAKNSLFLSPNSVDGTTRLNTSNILIGRDVKDPLQVLASLQMDLDMTVPHLRLRPDRSNPALDEAPATGRDALGNGARDLPRTGDFEMERDLGAVELLSLIA